MNSITGCFLAEFALTPERWASRSLAFVESWPDDPRACTPDLTSLEEITRELEAARERYRGPALSDQAP